LFPILPHCVPPNSARKVFTGKAVLGSSAEKQAETTREHKGANPTKSEYPFFVDLE
jgi:hypothetical protein